VKASTALGLTGKDEYDSSEIDGLLFLGDDPVGDPLRLSMGRSHDDRTLIWITRIDSHYDSARAFRGRWNCGT